jgi:hypothetical protein
VAPLSHSEEGCHSALFHTTIHFGHHLLFYKDGGVGQENSPVLRLVSHKTFWMSMAVPGKKKG